MSLTSPRSLGSPPSVLRRALVVAALLAAGLHVSPVSGAEPAEPDQPRTPTDAAAVFKWGRADWRDEFEVKGPPRDTWQINKPERAENTKGMLSLESARRGTVKALATDQAARYGRWEARVRARRFSTNRTPYQVVWELVPKRRYKCGSKSIVLADYVPGYGSAAGVVRTRPGNELDFGIDLDLSDDTFHTYAVEVTPDHVSWFVDTVVLHTERRPEALSGTRLQPRFRLQATKGERMDHGRLQVDWVRYHDLDRPNQQSIEAPEMTLSTYDGACPPP